MPRRREVRREELLDARHLVRRSPPARESRCQKSRSRVAKAPRPRTDAHAWRPATRAGANRAPPARRSTSARARGAPPDGERAREHDRHELDVHGSGQRERGSPVASTLGLEHRDAPRARRPAGSPVPRRGCRRPARCRRRVPAPAPSGARRRPAASSPASAAQCGRAPSRTADLERHPDTRIPRAAARAVSGANAAANAGG